MAGRRCAGAADFCTQAARRSIGLRIKIRPTHHLRVQAFLVLLPIQLSNSSQTCAIARVLCGPGKAVVPSLLAEGLLAPLGKRGDGAPIGAAFSQYAPSFPKMRRLSARHPNSLRHPGLFAGVFLTAPGRAFRLLVLFRLRRVFRDPFWAAASHAPRADRDGLPSASSWQAAHSGRRAEPRRRPRRGGAFVSPARAPHPIPLS